MILPILGPSTPPRPTDRPMPRHPYYHHDPGIFGIITAHWWSMALVAVAFVVGVILAGVYYRRSLIRDGLIVPDRRR